MGLPAIMDLLITPGAQWSSKWIWGNQAGAYILDGVRMVLTIGSTPNPTMSIIYQLDSALNNGSITFGPAQGQFNLFIPASITATFNWPVPPYFQLFVYFPINPSNPVCLFSGVAHLLPWGANS